MAELGTRSSQSPSNNAPEASGHRQTVNYQHQPTTSRFMQNMTSAGELLLCQCASLLCAILKLQLRQTGNLLCAAGTPDSTSRQAYLHSRHCEVGNFKVDLDRWHLAARLLLCLDRRQVEVTPAQGSRTVLSGPSASSLTAAAESDQHTP